MENTEREKILNRITQLIGKALDVKATHRPNPPNVISSVTLNKGAFTEWKNSVESFILKVAGENSHFYKNFEKEVKYESKSHVDAGVGILMAIKESVEQGDLTGGSVHFVQIGKEFTPECITIRDIRNPHKQYWGMIFGKTGKWILDHIIAEVIVAIIVAAALIWLGLNR